jgi:GH25 family lysozyme M1 (1,4-beta-N-acetylmuramidase)
MDISQMPWGPDLNHYHPVRSWDKLCSSGATLFGAKATEGVHTVDDQFEFHRDGFRANCPKFTMAIWYHFFHAEKSPVSQAEHFADVVGEIGPRERLCCDFEGVSYARVDPKVMLAHGLDYLEAFYARLGSLGALGGSRPLIYTSAQHWRAIGNPAWSRAASMDLWVPRYHLPDPQAPDELPRPWATWQILQYTDGDKGIHQDVPGCGFVDCNVVAGGMCSEAHPENG